jgi:K+-sensing histidine kinase KdpD
MEWIRIHRGSLSLAGGLVLPLAFAALMVPFRASFADAAAALVLVAVVAVVAIVGTRVGGYVAAVSACVWFDFFLTRPYEQLAMTHRPDIEIAASLFVVGVIVTELAARSRRHSVLATQESNFVNLIYEVAELSASGSAPAQVISRVSDELVTLLTLRECRFEPGSAFERSSRIERDGRVVLAGENWPVDQWGLPGRRIALLIYREGQIVGRFVLTPTPGEPVALQRRMVAVALADQVGHLLSPRLLSA